MTPEEPAARHPRLYHVTSPAALSGIRRLGLLSTSRLLDLYEVTGSERAAIERNRRPKIRLLTHPDHGEALITDNRPLFEKNLTICLDDGLSPPDWFAMLNRRVFFWVNEQRLGKFLEAQRSLGLDRLVIELDTLSVATRHQEQMELCPINSGSAQRRAARRGLSTFSPLLKHDYATWQRLRPKSTPDRIVEVMVVDAAVRVDEHSMKYYTVPSQMP